jgi:hypothetical protein
VPPRAQRHPVRLQLEAPLPALGMIDDGPQIGLCVLVVAGDDCRIIPKALKRAEQVIKVISGHPDADTQNAGVEHQPGTIPAA